MCLLISVSAVYCEKMCLPVTFVCQRTVIESLVKEKELSAATYVYALVPAVSEGG